MESLHDLEVLIESDHRLIVLETDREQMFLDGFRRTANRSSKAFFQWTITQGLERLAKGYSALPLFKDINQLFGQIVAAQQPGVYVLVDFHHYLEDPTVIRHLKDVLLKAPQHCLILLSRKVNLPDDLRSHATPFKLPLPDATQLKRLINDLAVEWLSEKSIKLKVADKQMATRLAASLNGLTISDAERLARNAIWNDGILDDTDIRTIIEHKFELLDPGGLLKLELDFQKLNNIAGLDNLKKWLSVREKVFSGAVKMPGADTPKGMLLLGVQGCGKSMAAKAVAGSWKLPLLHFDFGVLYNRFYGQTEENLRSALATAEKMQPCVLWIDEIEKGLSATSSSDDLSKRLLGTFLTWLAEKKSAVFVVATANNVSELPPELLRKGRFDEVFFVDLPDENLRRKILDLHLERRDCAQIGINTLAVAQATQGFSGAELEQVVVSALYEGIANNQSLTEDLLLTIASNTKPLSILMHEKVSQLQKWAAARTVPA